jgi:hypothetical protein
MMYLFWWNLINLEADVLCRILYPLLQKRATEKSAQENKSRGAEKENKKGKELKKVAKSPHAQ